MASDVSESCQPYSSSADLLQAEVVAFLESGRAFNGEVPRRVDTHAASIFLVGDRAWKLKRAVRFPYLDFSTAKKRQNALNRELRLNRRTAADVYIAVRPVTCESSGRLALDGQGSPVDWLLEMRRFPDGSLLSEVADREALTTPLLMRLAERIQLLHVAAPIARVSEGARRMSRIIDANYAAAQSYSSLLDPARVSRLVSTHRQLLQRDADQLDRRGAQGRIRFGHGDLHMHNIALLDGEPILFDCLEFNDDLATVDTLYDLSFLLMDFWRRGSKREANIVFNRYFDLSPDDEDSVGLLPLFMSVRALIRAHVCAAQSVQHDHSPDLTAEARHCVELAEGLLDPAKTMLLAVGGLSGTGKSTVAREVGGKIGRAPGARIIRSDVVRKRLLGLPPEARLPPVSYTPASSTVVYTEMRRLASSILKAGHCVIADAVFSQITERDAIEVIAASAAADFKGVWLETTEATRLARISARAPDASDADADVARSQERLAPTQTGAWVRLSADGYLAETTRRLSDVLTSSRENDCDEK